MEALNRILKQVKAKNLTSHQSMPCNNKSLYKCHLCSDTGWIETKIRTYKKCLCVEKHRIELLWNHYGVSTKNVKKINEYIPYDDITKKAKERAVDYVMNFSSIRIQQNNWFSLLGQPGAGKSHLVIAMGAALLSKGITVVYMPYTEVMKEIKLMANNHNEYTKLLSTYTKAQVLVIDDLFKDKVKNGEIIADLTDVDIKHIYPILNYRYYNSLPTLISTECTPEIFMDLDCAQGGRILERSVTKIIFKGESYDYRVKQFVI